MEKSTYSVTLSAVILLATGLLVIPATNGEQLVFAESDEPTVLVSEKLKNNPLAIQIIAEMEAQKLKYKQLSEDDTPKFIPTREQILVEENRKLSEEMLAADLKSMEKKYIDFTPKNSFEKFVSKLNETHHGIFWDQFDYLNAKVQLAIAAKNDVLENGGSFYDAQREYFKYASMPRLEMISYIQELNIKYGFAEDNIQSYFDPNGKLPRFEEDDDAPCYGCENLVYVDDSQTTGTRDGNKIRKAVEVNPNSELKLLQGELSELRQKFLKENDLEQKKSIVDSLNDTVRKIQDLTYN